ncbi:hypothetical protein Tco_0985334, partial [Tanacetum coccineum]
MTITRSGMTPEAIKELINRRVEEAIAAHEEARNANALETENQIQNGSDGDNGNDGNGNGGNGNGRNENPNENGRGLSDNIQGNVIAAEPTRLQDAVQIANNLMDQKLKGYVVKNAKNKRILEVNKRDNHGQQPPFKIPNVRGQNIARAYTAGNNEKKPYNGLLPFCNK